MAIKDPTLIPKLWDPSTLIWEDKPKSPSSSEQIRKKME